MKARYRQITYTWWTNAPTAKQQRWIKKTPKQNTRVGICSIHIPRQKENTGNIACLWVAPQGQPLLSPAGKLIPAHAPLSNEALNTLNYSCEPSRTPEVCSLRRDFQKPSTSVLSCLEDTASCGLLRAPNDGSIPVGRRGDARSTYQHCRLTSN